MSNWGEKVSPIEQKLSVSNVLSIVKWDPGKNSLNFFPPEILQGIAKKQQSACYLIDKRTHLAVVGRWAAMD